MRQRMEEILAGTLISSREAFISEDGVLPTRLR